jgi:hypothetical protein
VVLTTIFLVNTTLLAFLGSRRHRAGGRSVTDGLPSAPPVEATSSGMPAGGGPVSPDGMPPMGPVAAPSGPVSAAPAGEPVTMDTPAPASAPTPVQGADTGQKPAPQP